MTTEMYDTLTYSKPIKIKRNINRENNFYIKQKYNEYDYIKNNINEIIHNDEFMINDIDYNNTTTSINKLYNIYDFKENLFNPDKQSPPNSWKNRLMERIQNQTKLSFQ